MSSDAEIHRMIDERMAACAGSGSRCTAVLTFSGFPMFAQPALSESGVPMWGFSHGINSTFQYELDRQRLPSVILQVQLDAEMSAQNGEGVDVFTRHGTKKQPLAVTLYTSIARAPYWLRPSRRPGGADGGGMLLVLASRMRSPDTGEMVKVMERAFFQVGDFRADGGENTMKCLQEGVVSISFEPEEAIDDGVFRMQGPQG